MWQKKMEAFVRRTESVLEKGVMVLVTCILKPIFLNRSTANHHLLRNIAAAGGGTYEYYSSDTKSMWQRKVSLSFSPMTKF